MQSFSPKPPQNRESQENGDLRDMRGGGHAVIEQPVSPNCIKHLRDLAGKISEKHGGESPALLVAQSRSDRTEVKFNRDGSMEVTLYK